MRALTATEMESVSGGNLLVGVLVGLALWAYSSDANGYA